MNVSKQVLFNSCYLIILIWRQPRTKYFEGDLKLFENCFGIPLTRPMNLRKQVLFNSCHFTTIPGGWVALWVVGGNENNVNWVQLKLTLPVGTELGNI